MIKIKKGLDIPITGIPDQKITERKETRRVAVIGEDFVGLKPGMSVKTGDRMKTGQLLFFDKRDPRIRFTSPACGRVVEINRGKRRVFQSIVIEVDGTEQVHFSSFKKCSPSEWIKQDIEQLLQESGLWTHLRKRPFGGIADPKVPPHSLFITAMDTHPLSPDPQLAMDRHERQFRSGLHILSKLSPKLHLCQSSPVKEFDVPGLKTHVFHGPHPAGNVGTHIHLLDPVHRNKTVWHINYQDVIALGWLFLSGRIFTERIISLAGPAAKNPRLVTTHMGASLLELCEEETSQTGRTRRVSGSVLGGRTAWGPFDYLGRFHHQVSLVKEEDRRIFLGWQSPGFDKFSIKRVYASGFLPRKKFAFTGSLQGSVRSIVPIGCYEKVMPLDMEPTFLLRAIQARDVTRASELGALELEEEDLALCSFVDPCKNDFASSLRECLHILEKEG